jgi:nicotinamidase-related amidase
MTTINVVFLIDIQNGFARYDLSRAQGGCLYVPGGEEVGESAARLIRNAHNTIFVLSQDFHPENHVSFMTSHPAVMEVRKNQLRQKDFQEAELDAAILNPLNLPFDDILLSPDSSGRFRPIACGVGLEWRAAATDINGSVIKIHDHEISGIQIVEGLRQKLWSPHCISDTESALFVPQIMGELPQDLVQKLHKDTATPVLKAEDDRGNIFYVVRKGTRLDLDSYGIAVENDRISKTYAPAVFAEIALQLKERSVSKVNSYIGGLASNFCVEFSDDDVHAGFFPSLERLGINYSAHLLSDISRGIPIIVTSGAWPDLGNTFKRILTKGKTECTTNDVIRAMLQHQTADLTRTIYPGM